MTEFYMKAGGKFVGYAPTVSQLLLGAVQERLLGDVPLSEVMVGRNGTSEADGVFMLEPVWLAIRALAAQCMEALDPSSQIDQAIKYDVELAAQGDGTDLVEALTILGGEDRLNYAAIACENIRRRDAGEDLLANDPYLSVRNLSNRGSGPHRHHIERALLNSTGLARGGDQGLLE